MAALTVQTVAELGADVGAGAAAAPGGDTVTLTAHETGGWDTGAAFLLVRNGGAGAITCTVGAAAPLSIAAGASAVIPLRTGYGGATIAVAYSAVTTVTVAAVKLP